MSDPMFRHRRRTATNAVTTLAACAAAVAVTVLASRTAGAQSVQPTAATPAARTTATAAPAPAGPELQGVWDFAMRVGDRPTTGFLALGPVEGGWAGSLTPYLTNTLAIRLLTVTGDSVRMVVASREGDVRFQGRLTNDGRTMEGIVEYHGGLRVPMMATRRVLPAVPR